MFFSSSSRKKSAAGAVLPSVITATKDTANPDISSTTSLEQLTEAATSDTEGAETSNGEAGGGEEGGSPGKLDIRSRINNLAFIFTLPHLVMLSNLQKLIGIRTGKKPSIQVILIAVIHLMLVRLSFSTLAFLVIFSQIFWLF